MYDPWESDELPTLAWWRRTSVRCLAGAGLVLVFGFCLGRSTAELRWPALNRPANWITAELPQPPLSQPAELPPVYLSEKARMMHTVAE